MFTSPQLLDLINSYLSDLKLGNHPQQLYEPVKYMLSLGGKRLRPVLAMMAYNIYKDDVERILPCVAGIELYHNYTLLHDDLMDDSDMRRGKETVHKVWNDNTAILSGDAMLVLAYQYIVKGNFGCSSKVLDLFSRTALEICEGQQFDMDYENRKIVSEEEYIEMIRLKTGVLLAASLKIGGLQANTSDPDLDLLYNVGLYTGLAFQLKDDLLDVYGDPSVFGKQKGGDILCNKKTYLLIKAFEMADKNQLARLNYWMNDIKTFTPCEKIDGVIEIYDELKIRELCEEKMDVYFQKALIYLEQISVGESKTYMLKKLIETLMTREV